LSREGLGVGLWSAKKKFFRNKKIPVIWGCPKKRIQFGFVFSENIFQICF